MVTVHAKFKNLPRCCRGGCGPPGLRITVSGMTRACWALAWKGRLVVSSRCKRVADTFSPLCAAFPQHSEKFQQERHLLKIYCSQKDNIEREQTTSTSNFDLNCRRVALGPFIPWRLPSRNDSQNVRLHRTISRSSAYAATANRASVLLCARSSRPCPSRLRPLSKMRSDTCTHMHTTTNINSSHIRLQREKTRGGSSKVTTSRILLCERAGQPQGCHGSVLRQWWWANNVRSVNGNRKNLQTPTSLKTMSQLKRASLRGWSSAMETGTIPLSPCILQGGGDGDVSLSHTSTCRIILFFFSGGKHHTCTLAFSAHHILRFMFFCSDTERRCMREICIAAFCPSFHFQERVLRSKVFS